MSKSNLLGKVVAVHCIKFGCTRLGAPVPLGALAILLSFACDFAALHFGLFSDQIFELQLLAQFLMDFPKVCTMYLPMCNLHD